MGLKIHRRRRQHARPNNIVCVDATKTKSKKLKNERKKCFSFLCCVGLMDVSCVRLLVMLAAACKLGFSWNVENKIAIKRMGELRLARKNAKKQKREDFFLRCGETHDACWHRWTQLHNKQMKTLGVPTEDQQWSRFVQSLLRDENLICIIKTLSKRKHKTMFSKRDNNRWGRGKQSNFLWLRSEPMRLTDVARLLFCFFFLLKVVVLIRIHPGVFVFSSFFWSLVFCDSGKAWRFVECVSDGGRRWMLLCLSLSMIWRKSMFTAQLEVFVFFVLFVFLCWEWFFCLCGCVFVFRVLGFDFFCEWWLELLRAVCVYVWSERYETLLFFFRLFSFIFLP